MGAHDKDPQKWRNQIRKNMLHWVAVDGRHCNGGSPFVVLFMDVLVNVFAVQEPGKFLLVFRIFPE